MIEKKVRTAILISGRGSNMDALIEAAADPDYPAEIIAVISNRPKAAGLEIAIAAGIPTRVVDHKDYDTREAFDHALSAALKSLDTELICSAGFKRLLTKGFVDEWHNRQLNIHPSLLPAFKGLNTHERALEADVKIAGCTVHMVRFDMDSGPIILQAGVPVLPDDTASSLGERVLLAEHQIYPEALRLVASGAVDICEERAVHQNKIEASPCVIFPQFT